MSSASRPADAGAGKSSALLIIDVQRGLFDAAPRPADADAVIDRINQLSARARQAGTPVIFVQHEHASDQLLFGTTGWQLEQHLVVAPTDRYLRKTTPDSFLRTTLAETLAGLEVTRVIVCGYATEFCVDTTVRRAAALGFEVVLAADAHTTHDKLHATAAQIRAHHNATLPDIASFGPTISALPAAVISFAG